jgi:hypothetical protein
MQFAPGNERAFGTRWERRIIPVEGFRLLLALLLFGVLSACSAVLELLHPKKQEPNQYPAAYRTDLLDYLRNNPTAITAVREAYISAPSMKPFESESRYFVCVKASGDGEQVEKIALLSAGNRPIRRCRRAMCDRLLSTIPRGCCNVRPGGQEEMIFLPADQPRSPRQ